MGAARPALAVRSPNPAKPGRASEGGQPAPSRCPAQANGDRTASPVQAVRGSSRAGRGLAPTLSLFGTGRQRGDRDTRSGGARPGPGETRRTRPGVALPLSSYCSARPTALRRDTCSGSARPELVEALPVLEASGDDTVQTDAGDRAPPEAGPMAGAALRALDPSCPRPNHGGRTHWLYRSRRRAAGAWAQPARRPSSSVCCCSSIRPKQFSAGPDPGRFGRQAGPRTRHGAIHLHALDAPVSSPFGS